MKTLILAVVFGILSLLTFHDASSNEIITRLDSLDGAESSNLVAGIETYYGELFLVRGEELQAKDLLKKDLIEAEDGTLLYSDEVKFVYVVSSLMEKSDLPILKKQPSIDF